MGVVPAPAAISGANYLIMRLDRSGSLNLVVVHSESQGTQPFKYSAIHRLLHGHFQVNLAVQHPACRREGNSINFNG